jgi:rRNA biogenesis protein RRP5
VVKPKKGDKKKSGNVTAAALLKSPLAGAIGLGMTRLSGNSKALKIDNISFTKYTPGTLALGYILQIMDTFIVVSLPGGVTGTVAYSEISDTLHRLNAEINNSAAGKKQAKGVINAGLPGIKSLVSLMQPVRCYVVEVIEKGESKKKSLVLSMRSGLVNRGLAMKHMMPGFPISGCISSKEDHGYIVSAGVSATTFFLPFKAVPAALSLIPASNVTSTDSNSSIVVPVVGADLPMGQPIECVVEAVNEAARSVTLRAQRKATAESITRGPLLPFNALCPGMKFHVTVDKIAQV